MYSAEISVNGVKGYVGGSDALDLAVGVMACAEAIEQTTTNAQDVDYDNDLNDYIDLYAHCSHLIVNPF